jgi:hypothetical protein
MSTKEHVFLQAERPRVCSASILCANSRRNSVTDRPRKRDAGCPGRRFPTHLRATKGVVAIAWSSGFEISQNPFPIVVHRPLNLLDFCRHILNS